MPNAEELLQSIKPCPFRLALDLTSGYWQIPVNAKDRQQLAFRADGRLWQFVAMSFGLLNAPAHFQRAMHQVLDGLEWLCCLVYLDDIIVYNETFADHLRDLRHVFERLREYNLKLKIPKCDFIATELEYLGHILTPDGIQADPRLTKKILEAPTPRNKKDLQAFLGLINYYRKFVPKLGDIAHPLYHLTGNVPWVWSDECQNAFANLKERLTKPPILHVPDFAAPFELHTDASDWAIGAVLCQPSPNGERVIAYGSKILNSAERNYSTTEKELLAVVHFCKEFRHFLWGQPFTILTDHKPVLGILGKAPKIDERGRIARWREIMADFNFEIHHRAGKEHSNADALSRIHPEEIPKDQWIQYSGVSLLNASSTQSLQVAEKCGIIILDPPYAILHAKWDKRWQRYHWGDILRNCKNWLADGGNVVIFCEYAQETEIRLAIDYWIQEEKNVENFFWIKKAYLGGNARIPSNIEKILVLTLNPRLIWYPSDEQQGRTFEVPAVSSQEILLNKKGRVVNKAQKPVELIKILIRTFSAPDSAILDLTGGTGTTAIAASQLNRRCYVVEKDPHMFAALEARIQLEMKSSSVNWVSGDLRYSELDKAQNLDPNLAQFIKVLSGPARILSQSDLKLRRKLKKKGYLLQNGLLKRLHPTDPDSAARIVIPVALRESVMNATVPRYGTRRPYWDGSDLSTNAR